MTATKDRLQAPGALAARPAAHAGATRQLGRRLGRLLLHAFLILLSITCLLPLVWMISTSFKEQFQVFTYPPRVAARSVDAEGLPAALLDVAHRQLAVQQRVCGRDHHRVPARLLIARRLCLCARALPRPRRDLLLLPGDHDDPRPGDVDTGLHPDQVSGLDRQLLRIDHPLLVWERLWHLPAAPVLPDDPDGAGGCGAHRRRRLL